ncbi:MULTISPECIES: type III-A CRISPR-associated RAMP protein Csm3 [Pseudanabaena]|uniref:CRISPR system Cms endoribonuclease Csm3 n=2 Tax=Pseudanabaena TaxID=1152 RepID=L8MY49_9CYAN|nr:MULTISPECIES: type III-A CRISPR-associated RAMP protein Csm3 [Pseudanabaena]ELS30903.1 CRISPR-associated RAMP protein, Csm3 family [Pseudanabaena biceps PCC 7429]MDG3496836.1 type III-A CRISPR-associated RAMP protein Csm3 [Pseudanabaena catenata USMAC16]
MPAATEQKPLLGKLRLTSNLRVVTGLHIGAGGENLDIGGLDKSVMRDPLTKHPYLPGSSIKGKMRSILERFLNKPANRDGGVKTFRYESDDLESGYSISNGIPFEGARSCEVSRVFGSTGKDCWLPESIVHPPDLDRVGKDEETFKGVKHLKAKGRNSPARLIVRDSHLTTDSAVLLKSIDTGLFMTEWKFENGIDRITAAANPRQLERVPAGAVFNFEIVYTVENAEQAVKDLQNLAIALAILEDDALGGHGSRGYGKVAFENFQLYYRDLEYYKTIGTANRTAQEPLNSSDNTEQLLNNFDQVTSAVERQLPSGKS